MGRKYSVNGYINAALRRSNRTLLVEGITDKQILHRIALERYPDYDENITIDYAEMLEDPIITGFGKKEVIVQVQLAASNIKDQIPKIEDVLATLIDREWDGLDFGDTGLTLEWVPPEQGSNRFVTFGHSIENYHFDVDCAIKYLKYAFPEPTSSCNKILMKLRERFRSVIIFAVMISLVVRDDECLVKSDGLIDICHLLYQNDRYYLAESFTTACIKRNFINAATIVRRVNSAINGSLSWDMHRLEASNHWFAHGHLGNDVVWVCVGHMAEEFGISPQIAHEIAHGRKKDRSNFTADWLSKLSAERQTPLNQAIDWLYLP